MTVGAETLKVAATVVITGDDVINLCGLRATALTGVIVTLENSLPETVPVGWKPLLPR